ncbi:hypothetical protein [Amycolatopsis jejuensis]|uniref:hypothetical protein n=1 Tax=Amycolatopsis jejuensis TaxID=330084 RepID=UPI0005268D32|nr:hypothetical protein [Amycolatopsis jejuensis]
MSELQAREWLGRHLGVVEVDRLERIVISVAPARSLGMVTLLLGWYEHVARMEGELEFPDDDRSVWGAHDLIAADSLRDFIAGGLELVPEEDASNFVSALGEVDSRFRSYTEVDELGVLLRLAGDEPDARGWWWVRIPRFGPIRRELDRFSASL